jgi:hypothetical protein
MEPGREVVVHPVRENQGNDAGKAYSIICLSLTAQHLVNSRIRQDMTIRDHIILWKYPYDRAKDAARNNLLLRVHIAAGFIILFFFSPTQEAVESHGIIFNLLFMTIRIIGSFLIAASGIMLIPSWLFAKVIGPEIILTDDHLIFLGGSNAIKDSPNVLFFQFFIYLEGMENSLLLNRKDIKEIAITGKRDLLIKFKFGTMEKQFISITHNTGHLLIGGTNIDPQEFIERLQAWHQVNKGN